MERYLEIFCGYCQGAGINLDEGILLQLELSAGCQSLAVKRNITGEISGFHTEEDSTAYERFGNASEGKYWVNMKIGDKEMWFLHYGGLCGFGYSYSVVRNKEHVFFNIADVLGSEPGGLMWVNMVNFMLLNCADLKIIEELLKNLSSLPETKFMGGYTNTIMECKENPEIKQVEFGGNLITTIEAEKKG